MFWSFWPILKHKRSGSVRLRMIRKLEKARGSRVITLIHRQETISFIGFPIVKYISMEDSEEVLQAIRLTPPELPIDMILHTPGGLVLASEQIALALKNHPARTSVFIPHYAMSGGTMIAMAVDRIYMDKNAVLGPVDPQLGGYPAASILAVLKTKPLDQIEDKTLILADLSHKAVLQIQDFVRSLLQGRLTSDEIDEVVAWLTTGRFTHDFPLSYETVESFGFAVVDEVPADVYDLLRMYPQQPNNRPSVQYIPIPYDDK